MKKATWLQKAFARDWLAKLWLSGFVISTLIVLIFKLFPSFQNLTFSLSTIGLFLAILGVLAIAYLTALISGSCILPPLYRYIEKRNGAPFQKGDQVEILTRKHEGRVGIIEASGDPHYGAFVSISDEEENLHLQWHQIRKISSKNQ